MDEYTKDVIQLIREDIKELRKDMKTLIGFKFLILGYATALSAVVSIVVAVIYH